MKESLQWYPWWWVWRGVNRRKTVGRARSIRIKDLGLCLTLKNLITLMIINILKFDWLMNFIEYYRNIFFVINMQIMGRWGSGERALFIRLLWCCSMGWEGGSRDPRSLSLCFICLIKFMLFILYMLLSWFYCCDKRLV